MTTTERGLQAWVIASARILGWKVWHVPAPMRATRAGGWVGAREAAGLPDLILTHDDPPRLVFAELKGPNGKLTDAQQECLQALRDVAEETTWDSEPPDRPIGVYVWQPGQEDQIETLLRTRSLI